MYICIYIYTNAYLLNDIYTYFRAHMHTHRNTYIYIYIHIYIYICIHIFKYTYMYVYIELHVSICTSSRIFIELASLHCCLYVFVFSLEHDWDLFPGHSSSPVDAGMRKTWVV